MNHLNVKSIRATSLSLALFYCVGFFLLFTRFKSLTDPIMSNNDLVKYVLENKFEFQIWYLVIYILFGMVLLLLVQLLDDISMSNTWSKLARVFGRIWAGFVLASGCIFIFGIEKISALNIPFENKITIFNTLTIIQDSIGGGIELIGGFWVLSLGVLGIKQHFFKRFFGIFSIFLGCIGMITVFPTFMTFTGVFGVLQIAWFSGLSFCLSKKAK